MYYPRAIGLMGLPCDIVIENVSSACTHVSIYSIYLFRDNCASYSMNLPAWSRCVQISDVLNSSTGEDGEAAEASINEAQTARTAAVEAWKKYKNADRSMQEVSGYVLVVLFIHCCW